MPTLLDQRLQRPQAYSNRTLASVAPAAMINLPVALYAWLLTQGLPFGHGHPCEER